MEIWPVAFLVWSLETVYPHSQIPEMVQYNLAFVSQDRLNVYKSPWLLPVY